MNSYSGIFLQNNMKMAFDNRQKQTFYLWLGILLLSIAAWFIQNQILLSWDVSILLHETERLLSGGSYTKDFFETSPPMILYLYLPPVLLKKIIPLNLISLFRAYVFILSLFSIGLCQLLIDKIISQQDLIIKNLFMLALTATVLLFPIYELGQREHLFFVLSLPYLLAACFCLRGSKINRKFAYLIGFLAGLGFSIKPYFIVTPLCIEFYLMGREKSFRAWFRPECFMMIIVMLAYTVMAYLIHPDYFNEIVPYAMRLYYSSMDLSWSKALFQPVNIFCYFAILFSFSLSKTASYPDLSSILRIGLLSFIIICVIQRFSPYYHLLPQLSLAVILFTFRLSLISYRQHIESMEYFYIGGLGVLFLYFISYAASIKWFNYFMFPALAPIAWSYFFILFSVLLLLFERKNIFHVICLSSLILGVGYTFSSSALIVASNHPFSCSIFIMFVLFALLSGRTQLNKAAVLGIAFLSLIIFFYPLYLVSDIYYYALDYKKSAKTIISYLNTHIKMHSVYLFSTESNYIFPIIDYTQATSVSRFPYFWMLPALVKHEYPDDKLKMVQMISDDLNLKKPDYVFVDTKKIKTNLKGEFNYLNYLSENREFKNAWKCYHFTGSLQGNSSNDIFENYRFAIYQRGFCPKTT